MARGRGLLLVGVVVLLLITVLAVLFVMNQAASPAPDPNAQATLDAQPPVDGGQGEGQPASGGSLPIIIAAQDLERGAAIPTEALSVIPWPTEQVPPNAITDPEQVVGTRARYTIQRGEPIFSTMVVETLQQLSPFGSDTAARIPRGFTAISLPYSLITGAANAIRSGDYVNILVSMAFVDLDRDFQTVLPNLSAGVLPSDNTSPNGDGSLPPGMIVAGVVSAGENATVGRTENDPVLGDRLYVVPSEDQRSRLVSQSIIQNVLVVGMGVFGPDKPILPEVTAAPTDPAAVAGVTPTPVTPTPTPAPPQLITVAVSPQEALVLDYLVNLLARYPTGVNFTYTLRSAGDTSLAETQSVTLQYMVDTYRISLPTKLTYGLDRTPLPTPPAGQPVPAP